MSMDGVYNYAAVCNYNSIDVYNYIAIASGVM